MAFSPRSVAFLFILVTAASCFPLEQPDSCEAVRSNSLDLNRLAKEAFVQAREQSPDLANFTSFAWMESKDMCDPESLKKKSMPCVKKIYSLLAEYNSSLHRISGFPSCSKFADMVKTAVETLHENMGKCAKTLLGEKKHKKKPHTPPGITQTTPGWQERFLCRHTLDRLFSFSILTARVFAVGDPARHAEASAQKCM